MTASVSYLRALGENDQGKIVAHNILGAIEAGRLKDELVEKLLNEAAQVWAADKLSARWGNITCKATIALFDVIVDRASEWRFSGVEAQALDTRFAFVTPFDRVVSGDLVPLDVTKLRKWGWAPGLQTPGICDTVTTHLNDGSLVDSGAQVGQKFGVFWATRAEELEVLLRRTDAAAAAIELCGLYHIPQRGTALIKVASTKSLADIATQMGIIPTVPTFIEGLNNLRFLGRVVAADRSWGNTLNMGCFRIDPHLVEPHNLAGSPEVALPAMEYDGNFSAVYVGHVALYVSPTDEDYAKMLEKFFGPEPHVVLEGMITVDP